MTKAKWKFASWKRGKRAGRAWGFSNWKIGRKLGTGFGLMIVAMVVVTAVGSLVLYRTNGSIDGLVKERIPHSVVINTIKNDFRDILFSANKIIAMGDPQSASGEVATIEQASQFVAEGMVKLEQAAFLLPEEKQRIAELKKAYADFQPGREHLLAALKVADPQQAIEQARGVLVSEITPFGMGYLQSLDTLIRQHEELAAADGERASATARRALVAMLILAGVGCTLGVLVAVIVTRTITRPLRLAVEVAHKVAGGDLTVEIPPGGGDETGMLMRSLQEMNTSLADIVRQVRLGTTTIESASFEIASATSSLSERTEQQADALGQSATSLNQLAGTVSNTAANAGLANQQAQDAANTATRGGAVVQQVVHTMELIKKSSQRIADIIGVVDGIAFQTNILALNAAVEAARAGEQGRGFAVVASEVRNLAQRSAASSKEIKILIGESVSNVDAGSVLVDAAGKTMGEIMTSVQAVAQLMGEITRASQEQSGGIGAVNVSIRQMDEVTQQNAAMVEEAFGASEELKYQAIELGRAVSVFKVAPAVPSGDGESGDPSGTQQDAKAASSRNAPALLAHEAGSSTRTASRQQARPGVQDVPPSRRQDRSGVPGSAARADRGRTAQAPAARPGAARSSFKPVNAREQALAADGEWEEF
ncbi:MAG: methyl-accepting chemotaxis protein [Pseudomonadota bacterium]